MFGGKDAENRMKDLWAFSLNTKKYVQLKGEGDYPNERNGHTMEFYDNKLYIFGGIHDITWELDDLQVYDIQVRRFLCREINGQQYKKIPLGKYKKSSNLFRSKLRKGMKKSPQKRKTGMTQSTQCIKIDHLLKTPLQISKRTSQQPIVKRTT